jgi:tetratricopeptide (TPR) repeat protein
MSETQDLAELEAAFAKDPTSPAFIALSSAYLQQGRFMEAMVVCKKGIKSQPDNVDARILLARVYAEQGRVPKALEEVKALLEQKPDVAAAHFFHGQMLEKSGKFEDAIEAYKEALRKDRNYSDATAALKAKGIDWSPGPSPEEIAAAEAAKRAEEEARARAEAEAKAAAAAQAAAAQAAAAQAAQQQAAAAQAMGASGAQRRPTPATGGVSGPVPKARPTTSMPAFPANDPAFQGYAGAYGMFSGPVPVATAHRRLGPGFTFGLGALLLVVIVGVVLVLRANKRDKEEIVAHWKTATKYVQSDTTGGHKKAVEELEAALKIDDDQAPVLGQTALSLAILSVERGEKDYDARAKKAVEHAMKNADDQATSIAAQMIMLRDEGKAADAIPLAKKLNGDEAQLPISVRVALGRAYAASGKVQEMLKIAETLKDTPDPSALTFVGEALRRVGEHARARQALDGVMKNGLDHDPGRALRALIILEDDDVTNLNVAIDDLRSLKELGKDAVGTNQRGYSSLGMAVVGKKIGRPDRENDLELQAAKAALGSDPEVPLFEAKIALASGGADGPTKAIGLAQEAIKRDRVRIEPYLTLVEAATKAKNWAAADAALSDAAAVFGDNLELGLAKGTRLSAEGKHDEAIAHLKGMLAAHDVAEVYRDIGKVFVRKDDVNQGIEWLKKAAEKVKNRSPAVQANVYTTLGKAYAQAGDHKQAKEIFAESLGATSEYSVTYWWLGLSLAQLGEDAAAKDAFKRYVNAEPNGQYAEAARAKLNGG